MSFTHCIPWSWDGPLSTHISTWWPVKRHKKRRQRFYTSRSWLERPHLKAAPLKWLHNMKSVRRAGKWRSHRCLVVQSLEKTLTYSSRNIYCYSDQDIDCLPGASNWGEKQTFKQISVHRVASTMEEVQAGWYRHSLWDLGQWRSLWLDVCQARAPGHAPCWKHHPPTRQSVSSLSKHLFLLPRFSTAVSTYMPLGRLPCSTLCSICTFYIFIKVTILLYYIVCLHICLCNRVWTSRWREGLILVCKSISDLSSLLCSTVTTRSELYHL